MKLAYENKVWDNELAKQPGEENMERTMFYKGYQYEKQEGVWVILDPKAIKPPFSVATAAYINSEIHKQSICHSCCEKFNTELYVKQTIDGWEVVRPLNPKNRINTSKKYKTRNGLEVSEVKERVTCSSCTIEALIDTKKKRKRFIWEIFYPSGRRFCHREDKFDLVPIH